MFSVYQNALLLTHKQENKTKQFLRFQFCRLCINFVRGGEIMEVVAGGNLNFCIKTKLVGGEIF